MSKKSISDIAKDIAKKSNEEEQDYSSINEHVSNVLDEHLEMISAAHRSIHGSNHFSQIK